MGNTNAADMGTPKAAPGINSRDFVRLLSQHFGDGLIYLADEGDRLLLKAAIDYGLISSDGHVTVAGYRLWRQATSD